MKLHPKTRKAIHRIRVAYAYEWRWKRLNNQIQWFGEQLWGLVEEVRQLIIQSVVVPVAIILIIGSAICWLPWCFILRPIKYGIFNGEDVDKVEGWKNGRKKQPIINT